MNPEVYAQAIKDIESSGGNYGAMGPVTKTGDRAYGAYQVMGANVPDWTEQHYGKRLSPDEFLKNKDAQDAVFHGQFGSYVSKYGNPSDAASAWFTGRPIAHNNNDSDGYTSADDYVSRFNQGVSKYTNNPVAAINAMAGIKPQSKGALAFTNEDDEDGSEDTGPLSTDSVVGPGALSKGGRLMQGDSGPKGVHKFAQGLIQLAAAMTAGNPGMSGAFTTQLKNMQDKQQSKYKVMVGKDGRVYRIDDSGNVDVSGGPAGGVAHSYQQATKKDADGNVIKGTYDKATGQYQWPDAGPAGPPIGGDPTLAGEERLKSMTPDEQRVIQSWHDGTGVNPTSYSQRNPRIQKLMDAAQAVYPDMDFTKYSERQNFLKGYTNKSPQAYGGQVIGTDHTATLIGQLADTLAGLKNSSGVDLGPLGQGWGASGANKFKDATGSLDRSAAIRGVKQQADTLSTEFQTLMSRGKGGGQAERQEKSDELNQPDAAPENQAAPLQKMLDALKARHQEYVDAAKSNAGDTWLAKHPDVEKNVLDTIAKVQAKIDKLQGLNKTSASATPAAPVVDHSALDAELKKRGLL